MLFQEAEQVRSAGRQRRCGWAVLLTAAAVLCLVYSNRKVAHDYLERNIQEVIYPGMKLVRKLMLPLVTNFPALTEWYDEACLVGNPYFQVSDIDCWPCQGVRSILNLTMKFYNFTCRKLNRLEPTRAMRQLFGSLVQLPNYVAGATTEKFLLVDEQHSSTYQLPDTEGSNVFVVQGSGCRLLLLKPSPECQHLCHSVSILLPQHHVCKWKYFKVFKRL
ncbi:hypothetical protein AAG570_005700 [Ranatra chinensis]|uniref:Uncharacterized protein n=1 Tax=Ranatra chinensis TaxID=642074 RepID=A0ABD0XZV3_9HEMI